MSISCCKFQHLKGKPV